MIQMWVVSQVVFRSKGQLQAFACQRRSLGTTRTVYRSKQRDRGVQTTGPSFAPVGPEVSVRTQVRSELRVPEQVHVVPGNQCLHVFNPCYAFRHLEELKAGANIESL